MPGQGYALFDTALGRCALVWGERGLLGVCLPDEEPAIRRRLARRHPGAAETDPPQEVSAAIRRIQALLAGGSDDLAGIELDLAGVAEFNRRVYDIARAIPPGQTLTYGQIATRLGDPLAARDVGKAMGENPWPIVVPCHRVLAAGGELGGFSAPGGVKTKRRMLEIEGAAAVAQRSLFDD